MKDTNTRQVIIALFLVILLATAFYVKLNIIFSLLIAINIVSFIAYGYDKWLAINQKDRISEVTLQILALLGGSPAALAAMLLFRHKTSKMAFQLVFWAIVLLQVGVVVAYFLKK